MMRIRVLPPGEVWHPATVPPRVWRRRHRRKADAATVTIESAVGGENRLGVDCYRECTNRMFSGMNTGMLQRA
jgi:hypothetical protein